MKKHLSKLFRLLITVAVFVYIIKKFNIDFDDVFGQVVSPWLLLMGVIIRLVVVQSIAMNRWQLFLRQSGVEESIWNLVKIGFISSFMGVVLPSAQGGDVMRMYFIEKKHGFSKDSNITSSSTVLIERMIGFVLLSLIGLLSSILIPFYDGKWKVVILLGVVNVCLWLVIFLLTNRLCYEKLSRILLNTNHLKKVCSFVEKTHFSLVTFPYKRVLLPSVALIGLYQIVTIFVLYLVFLSFGIRIPFYQHMAFYPIIVILAAIPISISGLGIREGSFVYLYSLVNIPAPVCVGVSLAFYMVEVLSGVFVGGILYLLKTLGLVKI
ncbi:MAG: lysylphosphatidylglycerol synthase transmembrane domain-containing protein [Bacteroidia bacterium]|nr:lysylphosphatidylglycerol synthase transmembrane domain-containing protein [Bacteroidia bacterium]